MKGRPRDTAASKPATSVYELVFRNAGVDLIAPGGDAAEHVLHMLEALRAKEIRRLGAAAAHFAMDHNLGLWVEFADALGHVVQRDQLRARDLRNLIFVRLAHVDELELVAAVEFCLQRDSVDFG